MKLPHVLWVDNFSKVFRKSIPVAANGTYNSCLWTGYAAFVVEESMVSKSLMTTAHGHTVPGMPNDLCAPSTIRLVKDGIEYVHTNIRNHYERSVVLKYDVRNVPPKIDTKLHGNLKAIVDHPKNSTQNVRPLKLFKRNIGSNEGLVAVLSDIAATYGMLSNTCTDYVTLNVDENIYWRILKVYHNYNVVIISGVVRLCHVKCLFLHAHVLFASIISFLVVNR
jgi:hypothetical protein